MSRRAPTFIIADSTGQRQLAPVLSDGEEAHRKAAEFARNRGEPVVVYAVNHVATYSPPANVSVSGS